MGIYTPEQLAKEAGFNVDNGTIYTPCAWDNNVTQEVLSLVKLAVQAEREMCARECEILRSDSRNPLFRSGLTIAAASIRARGDK